MRILAGQPCIVTGASRGLGAAIARRFWLAGARLLLVARSAEALERVAQEMGGCAEDSSNTDAVPHLFACDLADPSAPARIVGEAHRRLGGVRVLVNNAGSQGPIGPAWENDWADWERAFRVNFLSPVDLCRRVVPLMATAGGKIVNISGGGATGPRPCFTAYASAKGALVRLSETLAEETRALRIDVNCVAPGAMSSAMTEEVLAAGPRRAGEREYHDAERIKQQGAASLERAAALCLYLASPASDGITGKLISAVWDPWDGLERHLDDLERTDVYTLRRIVPADRGLAWGTK
jgi:NAD(P)-dependent dehydrogenase (short-subunit alcohol dehydrogenase family)